jgi:hypothetical protein
MKRFIEGQPRSQSALFPERLDDWISEDNPVRAVDVFVDELELWPSALRLTQRRPAVLPIIPERCSSSTYTGI